MGRHISRLKLLLLIMLLQPGYSWAGKVIVRPGNDRSLLKKAVQSVQPFDTVVVDGGVFKEGNIAIEKPLVLLGKNNPVLDGELKYQVLSVFASNVTISGLTLRNSGISSLDDLAGIKVYNARNVVISGNKFENMFFAIFYQGCTSGRVLDNKIQAYSDNEVKSGNGIHCWKSDSMEITGNLISGQRDGIYFEFVSHTTIVDNICLGNLRYGLHFMFSHNNKYIGNTFQDNGAGVAVMYSRDVLMKGNVFSKNWGSSSFGLLIKEITNSQIIENLFEQNTSGIYMEGSSRNAIERNRFHGNGCALRIQASCDQNVVKTNNFVGNTFDVNTNGSLVMNSFSGNYWDKYEGYDLNRDLTGDIPYHPISLYSMIIEKMPASAILLRSFLVVLLDRTERSIPSLTPENLVDEKPRMHPNVL